VSPTVRYHCYFNLNSPSYSTPFFTNRPSQGPAGTEPLQLVHRAGSLMLLFSQPELVKPLQVVLALHSAASWTALSPACCTPRSPPALSWPAWKVWLATVVQAAATGRQLFSVLSSRQKRTASHGVTITSIMNLPVH